MNVYIQNVAGSGDEKLANGKTWIKAYGEVHDLPETCPVCGKKTELQGAHVQRTGMSSGEYIAPLCSTCNNPNNTAIMTIDASWLESKNALWLDNLPENGSFEL